MTVGQQLGTLIEGNVVTGKSLRVINGNVMTGVKTSADGFLGAHVTEVNVIPEGDNVHEIFGWIMPRLNDYSSSRAYMSWLMGSAMLLCGCGASDAAAVSDSGNTLVVFNYGDYIDFATIEMFERKREFMWNMNNM